MATIELPNFGGKDFWRNARLLLWSLIVTLAALDIFDLIQIPEYFAGMVALTYVIAGWVIAYHLIKRWRG